MSILLVLFAVIHLLFITAYSLLWFGLTKHKLNHSLIKLFVIGGLVTVGLDYVGLKILNLWHYQSTNLYEYALIAFAAHITLTPLIIGMIDYFKKLMSDPDPNAPLNFRKIAATIVAAITAGILIGLPIEFLNTHYRLWNFSDLSLGEIAGIPVIALITWSLFALALEAILAAINSITSKTRSTE